MKILTVDDAATVRQLVKNILQPLGHQIIEASNGREALEVVERHPDTEVILLDWEMPEMDGLSFLKHVRQNKLLPDTSIIMLTSLNKPEQILDALENGADEYIMKPFTEEIILEKLKLKET